MHRVAQIVARDGRAGQSECSHPMPHRDDDNDLFISRSNEHTAAPVYLFCPHAALLRLSYFPTAAPQQQKSPLASGLILTLISSFGHKSLILLYHYYFIATGHHLILHNVNS